MAVLETERAVSGRRIDEDVCSFGGGECHSLTHGKSLFDHMGANDPMGAYIGRWEDSRDLERPPFARRIRKVLEDSGEVHICVEEYRRNETILESSRDLL